MQRPLGELRQKVLLRLEGIDRPGVSGVSATKSHHPVRVELQTRDRFHLGTQERFGNKTTTTIATS